MPYPSLPRRLRSLPRVASFVIASVLASCGGAPGGPVGELSPEVSGGNGIFVASSALAGAPTGYEQHEYFVSGTAVDYVAVGPTFDDGRWNFAPSTEAGYRTRIVVRRPSDRSAASGVVLVEWLNVSGGIDADADYASLVEEIVRRGHVWVGVSAQRIGIEGGPIAVGGVADPNGYAGKGLKVIDPIRYGSLTHPGDGYAFDIYTQVARALRRGGDVLGGIRPKAILAIGESQSAMALTTYYDGVQPLTHAFDGFFIHSRASFALPLVAPGEAADLLQALLAPERPVFRDDLDEPVMELQTEGDTVGLLASSLVRQPDTSTFRLWEVAGTAHADRHLLGATADTIDCGVAINDGPLHVVAKAALRRLESWVLDGEAPPAAPRLDVDFTNPSVPTVRRNADGIALGGLRTPPVDVPVDVLSGVPSSASVLCLLLGTTVPLPDTRIAELYASRAAYVQAFGASSDAAIASGYVLIEDRDALLAYEQDLRVAP